MTQRHLIFVSKMSIRYFEDFQTCFSYENLCSLIFRRRCVQPPSRPGSRRCLCRSSSSIDDERDVRQIKQMCLEE